MAGGSWQGAAFQEIDGGERTGIIQTVLAFLRALLVGRAALAAENLALRHDRRRVVHFNVTTSPTAQWAAQQIVEAFPFEEAPRFLLRDRDGIYGPRFRDRVKRMGIKEVLTAPRAPWQNPFVERLIGSIRRECLDHVIVFGEEHLRRVLSEYFTYYHDARAHLSLDRNSPIPRPVCPPEMGKIVAEAYLHGLHHCYTRAA